MLLSDERPHRGVVQNIGSSKSLVERRRHSSYAKFRPNRCGYDAALLEFRLFCAATPQLDSVEVASLSLIVIWISIEIAH